MPNYGSGNGRVTSPMTSDVTSPTPPPAPNLAPEPFKPGTTQIILPNEVHSARAQRANEAARRTYGSSSAADKPAAPPTTRAGQLAEAWQTLKSLKGDK